MGQTYQISAIAIDQSFNGWAIDPKIDIDLLKSTSIQDLEDTVSSWITAQGFRYWVYAQELPPSPLTKAPFILGNYPENWVKHYFEHGYAHIDPVIQHCCDHVTPYIWPPPSDSPQTGNVRKFFGEARDFRLLSGISFPLHGPGSYRGLLSIALDHVIARNDLSIWAPSMMLIGSFIHEAVVRIEGRRHLTKDQKLTSREQECLTWAAIGKSSWEIGKLLNISERTANFHLSNVSKKLGVTSRQSAVARAISLGMINL